MLSLLNPFGGVWKRIRKSQGTVKEQNLVGDGFILGGILFIKPGISGVTAGWQERGAGEFPSNEEVLDVVSALSSSPCMTTEAAVAEAPLAT